MRYATEMANSELAPQPVAFYAAVFFLVSATYTCLIRELIDRIPTDQVSLTVRKIMRVRSITTLCLFGVASVVALKYPLAGLGICICCLIAYLKPDPPVAGSRYLRNKAVRYLSGLGAPKTDFLRCDDGTVYF